MSANYPRHPRASAGSCAGAPIQWDALLVVAGVGQFGERPARDLVGPALDKAATELTEGHVQRCKATGADDPKRRQEMTRELMQALGRLVR